MRQRLWIATITCLAYCIDRELYKAIDYLKEQVRVLLEQQQKDKRLLLNNTQKRRLAVKARKLTRYLFKETTMLFTPATVLGWYRKLIAQKYDGSASRSRVGRPPKDPDIVHWILKIKEENMQWGSQKICDCLVNLGFEVSRTTVRNVLRKHGYDPEHGAKTTWKQFLRTHWNVIAACDFFSVELLTRNGLVRCMVLFAIDLSTRKVEILGLKPDPNGNWMEQIARNVTAFDSNILEYKKYLIHDRDPLFTDGFTMILRIAGIEPVKLPPKSPNLSVLADC